MSWRLTVAALLGVGGEEVAWSAVADSRVRRRREAEMTAAAVVQRTRTCTYIHSNAMLHSVAWQSGGHRGVTQPSGAPRHFLRSGPLPSENCRGPLPSVGPPSLDAAATPSLHHWLGRVDKVPLTRRSSHPIVTPLAGQGGQGPGGPRVPGKKLETIFPL